MRKASLHIIHFAVLSFFSGTGSFRIRAALALPIALCWLTTPLIAQSDLEVRRCLAVESRRPIVNIFVDESDNKWVSNGRTLFQVQSLEVATPVALKAAEQSLLNLPGGNYDLRWPEAALNALLGTDYGFITAAFYHKNRQELWIGTSKGGAFQISAKSDLKLVNTYTNKNSKLRSNRINAIYINDSGDVWMGTDEGMLVGKSGRWSLEEKLFRFERIAAHGSTLWVLGDDFIWKINNRGTWVPVDVDERQLEGAIRDIAVDIEGRLWIASEIITRFDPETRAYQKFGPIEYYTSQYATALAIDQEDAIWVGTEDKGVYLIGKASSMIVNCLIAKELDCNSTNNDAALRVQADGGEAPYTYAWSNGGSGPALQNLGPGEYVVTVTDSKGKSKIAQAVIPDTRFTVEVQALQEESISGATDGSASVIVAGAPGAFQFRWSNGETTQTALQLPTGTHTVTVTDAKGCKAVGTVNIAQGAAPLGIAIEQLRSIPCAGDSNAALKVQISGGKAPFNYKWSNPNLTGAEPTDIPPGTYQLQVTDAAGNSESAIIAIKAPETLQATVRVDASATTDNADGKATANATGGTGNFNYRWSNGETTQSATRLAPGAHTVTITDANGCTTTAAVTITEDILPLSVSISETQAIRCAGNSEAALSVQVAGGKGPFRFQWNDSNLSGQEVSNLPQGSYSITVTDAAGSNQVANIAIKAPETLQATVRVDAS
ncbi:MAG TPA: hypothetical protein PKC76_08180, partial [Saprospiraceae bacterium]|nr:hypothetical protein [Saprospiraceae bacterium]